MQSWHFDKNVPIAMLGGLFLQTAAVIWWASAVNLRVEQAERTIVALEKKLEIVSLQAERLVRVETKMDGVSSALSEVKEILRRPVPRP
jgi:hypothetical protein